MYSRYGFVANPFDPLGVPRYGRVVPYPVSNRGFVEGVRRFLRKVVREGDPYLTVVIGGAGEGKTSLLRFLEQEALEGRLLPGFRVVPVYFSAPPPSQPPELFFELLEESISLRLREMGYDLDELGWSVSLARVKTSVMSKPRVMIRVGEGVEVDYVPVFFRVLAEFLRRVRQDCVLVLVDALEGRLLSRGLFERRVEIEFLKRLIDGVNGPFYIVFSVTSASWEVLRREGEVDRALARRFPPGSIYQVVAPQTYGEFKQLIVSRLDAYRLSDVDRGSLSPFTEDAVRLLYQLYSQGEDRDIGRVMQVANIVFHRAAVEGRPQITPQDVSSLALEIEAGSIPVEVSVSSIKPELALYKLSQVLSRLGRNVRAVGDMLAADMVFDVGGSQIKLSVGFMFGGGLGGMGEAGKLGGGVDLVAVLSDKPVQGDGRLIWIRLTPRLAYLLASLEDTVDELVEELNIVGRVSAWVSKAVEEGVVIPPVGAHRGLMKTISVLIEHGGEVDYETLRREVSPISSQALRSILQALARMKLVASCDGRVRLTSPPSLRRLYGILLEKASSTASQLKREFIATSGKTIQWYLRILREMGLVESVRVGNIARYSVRTPRMLASKIDAFLSSMSSYLSSYERMQLEEARRGLEGLEGEVDVVRVGLRSYSSLKLLEELNRRVEERRRLVVRREHVFRRWGELLQKAVGQPLFNEILESSRVGELVERVRSRRAWELSEESLDELESRIDELESKMESMQEVQRILLNAGKMIDVYRSIGGLEEVLRDFQSAVDRVRGLLESFNVEEALLEARKLFDTQLSRMVEELIYGKLGALGSQLASAERLLALLEADRLAELALELQAIREGLRKLGETGFECLDPGEALESISRLEESLRAAWSKLIEDLHILVSEAFRKAGRRELAASELQKLLNVDEATLQAVLDSLEKEGRVKRIVRLVAEPS